MPIESWSGPFAIPYAPVILVSRWVADFLRKDKERDSRRHGNGKKTMNSGVPAGEVARVAALKARDIGIITARRAGSTTARLFATLSRPPSAEKTAGLVGAYHLDGDRRRLCDAFRQRLRSLRPAGRTPVRPSFPQVSRFRHPCGQIRLVYCAGDCPCHDHRASGLGCRQARLAPGAGGGLWAGLLHPGSGRHSGNRGKHRQTALRQGKAPNHGGRRCVRVPAVPVRFGVPKFPFRTFGHRGFACG